MTPTPRERQPRCNLCGRFAFWDALSSRWLFACTYWDDYTGAYEHE